MNRVARIAGLVFAYIISVLLLTYISTLAVVDFAGYLTDLAVYHVLLYVFLITVHNQTFVAVLALASIRMSAKLGRSILITSLILSTCLWLQQGIVGYGSTLAVRGLFGLQPNGLGGHYISVWELGFYILLFNTVHKFQQRWQVIVLLFIGFEVWFIFESLFRMHYLSPAGWAIIPYAVRILLLLALDRAFGKAFSGSGGAGRGVKSQRLLVPILLSSANTVPRRDQSSDKSRQGMATLNRGH